LSQSSTPCRQTETDKVDVRVTNAGCLSLYPLSPLAINANYYAAILDSHTCFEWGGAVSCWTQWKKKKKD
jgi:hypothetical protein